MFRRRTDQVYATLQQVQRRITEQAGGQTPADGSAIVPSAPVAQTISPLHETLGRQARPQLVQIQPEIPPPPMQLPSLQGNDGFLSISKQMAVTLVVLWISCCVFFFWIGQHSADRHEAASAGYAAGEAGNREGSANAAADAGAGHPLGDYVLVLDSVPSWTQEAEDRYRSEVAELNAIMVKNTARGWKPWFGIRKPDSGELELVFGEVAPEVYGVNKADFTDFALLLKKARGYNYVWVTLGKNDH